MLLFLNILWFIFGGFLMGIVWVVCGILTAISIIGLPWSRACFMLAKFSFWPFGRSLIRRDEFYGREDIGTGALGFIGNIIWFIVCGFWLAFGHVILAVFLACTLIGIPFAVQHLKLAIASLFPIGSMVIRNDMPIS